MCFGVTGNQFEVYVKSRIVYGFVGLFATVAMAHAPREPAEPIKASAGETVRDADVQLKRSSLRATLKSQTDVAMKSETQHTSERQLSARERADLRQQLRQQ
jgi:hypothetical protein